MRCLVTGAAGFLGSHLCDRLIKDGWTVVGMDNMVTGSVDNVRHLMDTCSFSLIRHDVSRFISVDGPLDAVFHFASPASPID